MRHYHDGRAWDLASLRADLSLQRARAARHEGRRGSGSGSGMRQPHF